MEKKGDGKISINYKEKGEICSARDNKLGINPI